jgi:hypothetical protein
MPNRKYPPELERKVKDDFRNIWLQSPKRARWDITREIFARVSLEYPRIPQTTIARWGRDVVIELGLSKRIIDDNTDHDELVRRWKVALEAQDYEVESDEIKIMRFMKKRGVEASHPDLIAIKQDDEKLVEVIDRGKKQSTFVDQLERYSRAAKLIVVLPIHTTNIQFKGKQEL